MKKGIKAGLIAAAGCIVLGAVLICAGSAAGGKEQLENMDGPVWEIRDGVTLNMTYEGAEAEKGEAVYEGDFSTEIPVEEALKNLNLDIGVHSVRIEEHDENRILLEGADCKKIQCYVKNGTLYLKDIGKNKTSAESEKRQITLTLPEGLEWEDAELSAGMGSIEMATLKANEADLEADLGNIFINQLWVSDLEACANMGNVEVDEFSADTLDISADMGHVEMSGRVEKLVDAEANMGSVVLELEQVKEDFNYRIISSMGSVKLGEEEYSQLSDERKEDNGAAREMELDSSMGSIEISFR